VFELYIYFVVLKHKTITFNNWKQNEIIERIIQKMQRCTFNCTNFIGFQ